MPSRPARLWPPSSRSPAGTGSSASEPPTASAPDDADPEGDRPMTTTIYIEYLLPGAFLPEEDTRAVPNRDPRRDAAEAPAGAFAFTYHDVVTATVAAGGEQVATASPPRNRSGRYYLDAEELTAADVAALPGYHRILLDNMRCAGWSTVVRCRTGNFQPKAPGDVLVTR